MKIYFKEELRVPATVGVLSFSVGVGVGYLICARRAKTTVEEITETWVVEVEEENQLALDFARAAEEQVRHPVHTRDIGLVPDAPPDDPRGETQFDPEPEIDTEPVDGWNQEEEEAERGPDAPYVIHREEFFVNETGYAQSSLEYFAGDNVLCDNERVPVYGAEKIVGRLEFGRGSGDSDLVYIRNEKNKSEWEVIRNEGSYQVEVLGIEIEEEAEEQDLRHSQTPLRFRQD